MDRDRANSKHGPRLDEEMAHELKDEVRGGPTGGRAEEWRDPEPPAEGEPEVTWTPQGHHGVDTEDDRDPDYREERARIGKHLPRAVFPATGARIVAQARKLKAPEDVLEALRRLDPAHHYSNAQELWKSLHLSSGPRF
jgi:Protein of unknown function (DUF2795)